MIAEQDQTSVPIENSTLHETVSTMIPLEGSPNHEMPPQVEMPATGDAVLPESKPEEMYSNEDSQNWHAEAGRKGARRVHELIREGKLYEQEHGLKSGRQRLRQLIELGKLYEQEHRLRPDQPQRPKRLSRNEREELLTTFLQCLSRIVKPSFQLELLRLIELLTEDRNARTA